MFPHVVRRLLIQLLPFRRRYLHELVVRRNVVPRMSVEGAVACVEINQRVRLCGHGNNVASMAWKLYAIEQAQS